MVVQTIPGLKSLLNELDKLRIEHATPGLQGERLNYCATGFPTRSHTNQHVQSQKVARSWEFWIYEEQGLHYPSSKNKGTEQLCSYCTAVQHLCFCIGKNSSFLIAWLI